MLANMVIFKRCALAKFDFEGQRLLPMFFNHCSRWACLDSTPHYPFEDYPHLGGALVVGIVRVAKAGWFSGVNNLLVIQFVPFVCLLSEFSICWVTRQIITGLCDYGGGNTAAIPTTKEHATGV